MIRPPRGTSLSSAKERALRVDKSVAQDTWVAGRILVRGLGEARHTVQFPVLFNERPIPMPNGVELTSIDTTRNDYFPKVTGIVESWVTQEVSGNTYYVGAQLAMSVTGRPDQELWVSYAFFGKGLTTVTGLQGEER